MSCGVLRNESDVCETLNNLFIGGEVFVPLADRNINQYQRS